MKIDVTQAVLIWFGFLAGAIALWIVVNLIRGMFA